MDFLGRFIPAIIGCIAIGVWWNLEDVTDSVALADASPAATTAIQWTSIFFLYVLLFLGVLMVIKSVSLVARFFQGKRE